MTPKELLEEVKSRFVQLVHNEKDKLDALLRQALGTYQDKAGVQRTLLIDEATIANNAFDLPEHFLTVVLLKDARGRRVRHMIDEEQGRIMMNSSALLYPLKMSYLVNLRNVDLVTYQLPAAPIGMIQDYLEVLIEIPNNERIKLVMQQGGFDVASLPSTSETIARKNELELQMKSARSAMPMMTI